MKSDMKGNHQMTPEKIAEGRALVEAATPLPWEVDAEPNEDGEYGPCPDPGSRYDDYMILGATSGKIAGTENSTHKLIEEDFDEYGYKSAWDVIGKNNAALIVSAVNAYPAYLDLCERVGRLATDREILIGTLRQLVQDVMDGDEVSAFQIAKHSGLPLLAALKEAPHDQG